LKPDATEAEVQVLVHSARSPLSSTPLSRKGLESKSSNQAEADLSGLDAIAKASEADLSQHVIDCDVDEDAVKPAVDLTTMTPTEQLRAVQRKAVWKLFIGVVLAIVS
jgi:hypothetical protein